jgi:hypothetical protein
VVQLLLVLLLSVHLLAANLAGAAPLVSMWFDWREARRDDALAGDLGRYLLRQALVWLTVGIALGAATLGLVWLVEWETFYGAASRLPAARFWWGLPELAFYYVCVAAYVHLWRSSAAAWRVGLRRFLGLVAATNLLYHFPLLFTVIGVYGGRVLDETAPLEFRRAILDAEVLSQFVHHLLASFAVVGMAMMGFALRLTRSGGSTDDVRRVAVWGGRVALVPTVLQLLVGTYVLVELPEHERDRLLGGDPLATTIFAASLVGAIVLMHRLASVAFGEVERRDLVGSMALLLLVVVAMVGARQSARQERLVSQMAPGPQLWVGGNRSTGVADAEDSWPSSTSVLALIDRQRRAE